MLRTNKTRLLFLLLILFIIIGYFNSCANKSGSNRAVEGNLPKDTAGGVFHIEIQKDNCTILNVSHGK